MMTRNVFLSAAKNLEKKDGTTDREQCNFALSCASVDYKNRMFVVPSPKNVSAHGISVRPRQQSQEHIQGFPATLQCFYRIKETGPFGPASLISCIMIFTDCVLQVLSAG